MMSYVLAITDSEVLGRWTSSLRRCKQDVATKVAGSNKILGHYLGSALTTAAGTTLYAVNTKQTKLITGDE